MRRILLGSLITAFAFLAGCAAQERWPLATGQHAQRFRQTIIRAVDTELLLYLPGGFDARDRKKYPLLIFLHGSGESGHELDRLKAQGPPQMVDADNAFPFIVASPQAPDGWRGFDPATLNALLDELIRQLPVDVDRIYLTGLSMGGIWSYGWAEVSPERFAAIVPVCGAGDPQSACALKHVPVWAFHGAQDTVVPVAEDQAMIDAINQCGGDARITVYPQGNHNAWTATYANPDVFTWLLAHRRNSGAK